MSKVGLVACVNMVPANSLHEGMNNEAIVATFIYVRRLTAGNSIH